MQPLEDDKSISFVYDSEELHEIPLVVFGLYTVLLISLAVNLYPASASDKAQTFSGEVSDAMCGAQHMMEGGKAECTRACVGKGSKYAFVVGAEVYTLDSSDKKVLDELDNLAGQKATINGTADGDTIKVSSVAPAK